ncbi:restriction endonuclease subunit S [Clostridium perfringens]|uniref:restriction endonuclease subunit S n=1 Tax=Clostridium perfringens TaxID=1502 RepID=UPI003F41E543
MNVYKLKEIFIEFKDGDWIESKNQSEDGIRLIQTGNIGNGIYIEKSTKAKFISEKTMEELNCNEIFEGDILISRLPSPVGRACILPNLRTRAITAVDCTIGRIDYKICNRKYFIYFTMSDDYSRQINKFVVGTTRKRISRKNLEEINISLPNIAIQNKIVEKLDIALELINKRKLQIKELDLLVKSKFIEMFGDPVSNSMRWDKKRLADECNIITGNTPSRKVEEYYGNYIEWIKSDNITNSGLYLTTAREYLSEEGLKVGRSIDAGSILMTCIAGSIKCIGNVAMTNRKVAFNQQINGIEPLENNVYFMFQQFKLSQKYMQSTINMSLKGILSKGQLSELEFIFPPIEKQNEFARFFKQIDKLKFEMEQSLKELEDNFNSLMQKSFNI